VQTLAPGDYRAIKLGSGATLTLGQGIYNVSSISLDNSAKLLFQNLSSGPTEVRVANQMTTGNTSVVGPDDSDPLKAAKIVFYVPSQRPPAAVTPAAVSTGNGSTLLANIYAPNGTLVLNNGTNATGAFLAKNVNVGNGVHIDLESFFTHQPPAITSANATTFTIGQAGTFTVTTTGLPTVTTITRSGALPSGVMFTDNGDGTATLNGTPAPGTGGSYPLMFTASNGVPPDATQNFTLTVKIPQTISFTSSAPSNATAGGATYTVTATATSGLPVTFTIDASASTVC